MGKLYYKYGTMRASKSMELLRFVYNYKEVGIPYVCLIPSMDTRSNGKIKSRALHTEIDAITINDSNFDSVIRDILAMPPNTVVFVDEAQFLSKSIVEKLRVLLDMYDLKVFCFGLKSNYKMELFEGSYYLLVHADEIDEIKTICCKCGNHKAIYNILIRDGKRVTDGNGIFIGDEEFLNLCSKCVDTY